MEQRGCVACGGQLQPAEKAITQKRRPKFGALWLIFTIFTGGLAFLLWLVMPRHKEVVSVDRYVICTVCGQRQP